MNAWYAAHTQPNGEHLAMQHLRRQGFEVYMPKFLKRRSHARKVNWVGAPLFPRYLFVGMDIEQRRWRTINSTVGVAYLVCFGEEPMEVPSGIILSLKCREDATGMINLPIVSSFKRGDSVGILDSVFMEMVGKFENLDAQGRVTLLLELMGREVKVTMPQEHVAAIG